MYMNAIREYFRCACTPIICFHMLYLSYLSCMSSHALQHCTCAINLMSPCLPAEPSSDRLTGSRRSLCSDRLPAAGRGQLRVRRECEAVWEGPLSLRSQLSLLWTERGPPEAARTSSQCENWYCVLVERLVPHPQPLDHFVCLIHGRKYNYYIYNFSKISCSL